MWIINLKIKVRISKEYQQTGSTVTGPHVTQFTAHASLVAENHSIIHQSLMESRVCFLPPARVCRVLMMKLCFRSLFRRWLVPVSKFWGFDAFICRHQLTHSEDVWVDYIPAVFVRFCSAVTALLSCEQQQRQAVVCQHFGTPGITSCPDISLWSLLLLQWAAPTRNLTGFPSE